MQIELLTIIDIFLLIIGFCSLAYLFFALLSIEIFNIRRRRTKVNEEFRPPVTLLKPICGLDPELEENLRSFCNQDYPEYQIIFGLHDYNDAALEIVKKIVEENKHRDVSFIVNKKLYGTNHKVSNLINMYPDARYDYLLVADSDMRVTPDYLAQIMSGFNDEKVAAVTCLYSGSARGKLASALNAMFINEWFFPSVLISRTLQQPRFCLGATMVVKKSVLESIGGLHALKNYLADDYMLGKLITQKGYKINMVNFIVENVVEENSVKDLFVHELRWARTLKRVEPLGYITTFLTDSLVISCLMSPVIYSLSGNVAWSLCPALIALLMRTLLHIRARKITASTNNGSVWLIPVRDVLSFIIRLTSFAGNSVLWRNHSFSVDHAGLIHDEETTEFEDTPVKDIPNLATTQDY